MKLATLRDGSRDGRLVVLSDDAALCADASAAAPTLQAALDDWRAAAPRLDTVQRALSFGEVALQRFEPAEALAPLPRAYAWLDGSAYLNHMALARRARGAEMPPGFRDEPVMYQGRGACFLGPTDPIPPGEAGWGLDFEAELAVVTGDVPAGASEAEAASSIRLLVLLNDLSLRGLIRDELAKGFGFAQSKAETAFAPVAVTPDELGEAWADDRASLRLEVDLNGAPFGRLQTGEGMAFGFGRLVAHAARTRALTAGTIVGAGTVSNVGDDGEAVTPCAEGGRGYACLAEARMAETLRHGEPSTPWLGPGDRIRIECLDAEGRSVFGAIDQTVGEKP